MEKLNNLLENSLNNLNIKFSEENPENNKKNEKFSDNNIKHILFEYTQKYKSNYYSKIKADYPEILKEIEEKYNYKTFAEKLYNYIYGDNVGICPNCGKKCTFLSINRGYRKACSNKCMNELGLRVSNMKKTMLDKYGTDNSNAIPGVIEKIIETNQRKYGTNSCMQLDEYKEKSKKSCLERFGAENPMYVKSLVNKQHNTLKEKYGVEYALQNKNCIKKQIQTVKNRYGVEHYSKTEEYHKKFNDTMIKKYGTTNFQEIPHIKEKIRDSYKRNFYNNILLPKLKNGNITPLFSVDDYSTTYNYYSFQCDVCGTKFKSLLIHGRIPKCPKCYPQNESNFENEVFDYISSVYSGQILHHDRTLLFNKKFEIDIYLPDKKLAFECDGIYWHSEKAGKDDIYHLRKTEECENKGVQLIHIFESDWMLYSDSVKQYINKLLNIKNNNNIISNENIIIRSTKTIEDINDFYRLNYFLINIPSNIHYVAYNKLNNDILAIMSFNKIDDGNYKLEAYLHTKFVTENIYKNILNEFIKEQNVKSVIVSTDRRYYNTNNIFVNEMNFKFIKYNKPRKLYFSGTNYKLFLQNVTPEGKVLTNSITDCGTIEYKLNSE